MNLSRQLPSRLDLVPVFIEEAVSLLKKDLSLDPDQIFDIKLTLEEALTNAIRHGNQCRAELPVEVQIACEGRRLTIRVRDQGKGFDFHHVPDPTAPEGLTKTSGRGIFLMRKIMDEVIYSDAGRELTLTKIF